MRSKLNHGTILCFCCMVFFASSAFPDVPVSWTDRSTTSQLAGGYTDQPVGGAAVDFNGDGNKDLLIGFLGKEVWEQTGISATGVPKFTYDTDAFPDDLPGGPLGLTISDYDNDGDIDLYVPSLSGHKLFENIGGIFNDVTSTVGSNFVDNNATIGGIWGDFDGDGDVDLLLLLESSQMLLRNTINTNQEREFVDCTSDVSLESQSHVTSASWGDLNGDHDLDLILIASCTDQAYCLTGKSRYFVNMGDNFGENETILFPNRSLIEGHGCNATIADFDNDGQLDVGYLKDGTEFTDDDAGIGYLKTEMVTQGTYSGEAKLVDGWKSVTWTPQNASPYDLVSFDYNLDGRMDILGLNVRTPYLYENDDDYTFPTAPNAALPFGGSTINGWTRGSVVADFVEDGLSEIFFSRLSDRAIFFKASYDDSQNTLYWAGVRLQSEMGKNNYNGQGATVILSTPSHIQAQVVCGGGGGVKQQDLDLTFGFGESEPSLICTTVKWPDGGTKHFNNLTHSSLSLLSDDFYDDSVQLQFSHDVETGDVTITATWQTLGDVGSPPDPANDKIFVYENSEDYRPFLGSEGGAQVVHEGDGVYSHKISISNLFCNNVVPYHVSLQSLRSGKIFGSSIHSKNVRFCLEIDDPEIHSD